MQKKKKRGNSGRINPRFSSAPSDVCPMLHSLVSPSTQLWFKSETRLHHKKTEGKLHYYTEQTSKTHLLPFCWRTLLACSGSMCTSLVTKECPSPWLKGGEIKSEFDLRPLHLCKVAPDVVTILTLRKLGASSTLLDLQTPRSRSGCSPGKTRFYLDRWWKQER